LKTYKRNTDTYLHSVLSSVLDREEWLTSRIGLFASEKEPRYALMKRLGGLQKPVWKFWRRQKNLS